MPADNLPEAQSRLIDDEPSQSVKVSVLSSEKLASRRRWRHLSDKTAKVSIAVGGISVIVAAMKAHPQHRGVQEKACGSWAPAPPRGARTLNPKL